MLTRRTVMSLPLGVLAWAKGIEVTRVSAITDEIATSSQGAVEFVKQYGLRYVELRSVPGVRKEYVYLPGEELRAESRILRENGLEVSFLNSSLMKVMIPGVEPARWARDAEETRERRRRADEARFERRMEDLKKAIQAARILGADKLRVFTGWRGPDPAAALPRAAGILNEMSEVAAKEKITLLVENEGACNVATCAELAALMKLVPSKWVGINWDPYNGVAHKEPPFPDGYRLLPKKRIGNVQIKGRSILDGPQKLDWRAIMDALIKDGYKGRFGLETHTGDNRIQASHDSMREILKIAAN